MTWNSDKQAYRQTKTQERKLMLINWQTAKVLCV